jgi:predicted GNAT family N-acyltransferase
MLNVLNKIRRWHLDDPLGSSSIRHVAGTKELKEALLSACQCPDKFILIPLGYRKSDVVDRLNDELLRKLEIIIRPPRPGLKPELDELPNASLLEDRHIVNVQDPLPALRKSLLRLRFRDRIRVRELKSEDDFRQYFSLRYRVWRQMGYLPPDQDCPASRWELNFTDRAAYPLGVFTPEGTLIACARLVFPLGQDSHHLRLIHKLVAATGDPKLAANLERPKGLRQLLDLLDSFPGFHEYFKRLIRSNVRAAEVSRVIVAPEHREQGLGEVLVDSLLSLASQRQLQVLFLAATSGLRAFTKAVVSTCSPVWNASASPASMPRRLPWRVSSRLWGTLLCINGSRTARNVMRGRLDETPSEI